MAANPIGPQIRIRDLREAHGLSVKQLIQRIEEAGLAGVHEDTIRNVELGHKRASVPLIAAWAQALGLQHSLDVWQPPAKEAPTRSKSGRNQIPV